MRVEHNQPVLERSLLPLGTGRVTICEQQISTEPGKFALEIKPEAEEEVIRVVNDIAADVWDRTHSATEERKENRVSWEVERAIRNMSRLKKPSRKEAGGLPDPLEMLAHELDSRELLCAEVFSRLNLWRRTRTRLEPANIEEASKWVRNTLKEVNYGLVEDVSLPREVKVVVPFDLLPNCPHPVTVIDTKGLERDDYAVRPDIIECISDGRTIIVLCSPFNSLPDVHSQQLLSHILETRPESVSRCVVLGLPKFGEAMQTQTDSGDPVESKQDAYDLKLEQAHRELRKMELGHIGVRFFDSISDDPEPVTNFLTQQVTKMRLTYCERIQQLNEAVQQLIKNYEDAKLLEGQAQIRRRLMEYVDRYDNLPVFGLPPYGELLNAIPRTHQRTVWASARRRGTWRGLNVYFHLGEGMLIGARKRSSQAIEDLKTLLSRMMGEESLVSLHGFLKELERSCEFWAAQFYESVKRAGEAAFLPSLKEDPAVWDDCVNQYGTGRRGFRDRVSADLEGWFQRQESARLLELLENKVGEAWRDCFIVNLKNLAESLAAQSEGEPVK